MLFVMVTHLLVIATLMHWMVLNFVLPLGMEPVQKVQPEPQPEPHLEIARRRALESDHPKSDAVGWS